jgi:hypothetical protein
MMQLVRMFAEIAILRRGPQDLPASTLLAGLVSCCYVLASAVQAQIRGWDGATTVLLLALDLAMQALWLWGLLMFFAKRARFLQTFSAFMGVNVLLTLLDIGITGVQSVLGMPSADAANPWHVVSLCLMLVSLGGVLQQALERSLFSGMALTLVIMLTIAYVAQVLVPGI